MLDSGVPEWLAEALIEMFKFMDSTIKLEYDLGTYKNLTGEEPIDLKKWVAKHAAAFQ